MALGKNWRKGSDESNGDLEIVRRTSILGRKRAVLPRCREANNKISSPLWTPSPKRQLAKPKMKRLNRLESLHQDVLVDVICKVNHSDLKQLLLVSKCVHRTALIARDLHFAFSTPTTKPVFNKDCELGEEETHDAPKQRRVARSLNREFDLRSIASVLFPSP